MALKIFISYRRQDSGANAIGISQYLEKEFGRKNVYIDVEMQAGTKYPAVIEKRLSECRVLLVLIGPDWINTKDEQGRLRLQKSDDWVRIEIARALEREIAVIPVLINGAPIPDREQLPPEIQELLDHQVASVGVTSFRHEMAGLVRDIRAIKPRRSRTLTAGAIGTALFLFATAILGLVWGPAAILDDIRRLARPSTPLAGPDAGVLKVRPGDWIFYATDAANNAYFLNTHSVRVIGDRIAYRARFALRTTPTEKPSVQAAYEDNETVLHCKTPNFAVAERAAYSSAGEVLFRYKFGEAESLELGSTFAATSIVSVAQRILCDDVLRGLVSSAQLFDDAKLSYIGNTPNGEGALFYDAIRPTTDAVYKAEARVVLKAFKDRPLSDLLPNQTVNGLPTWTYHASMQNIRIACAERKMLAAYIVHYDRNGNPVFPSLLPADQPIDVQSGSLFDNLRSIVCRTTGGVSGSYEGLNKVKYDAGGEGEQRLKVVIEQNGADLKVKFESPNGGQGEGSGKLINNTVDKLTLQSTTPNCPGSYDGSLTFDEGSVRWSYTGQDCGGAMNGNGTATRGVR